MKFIKEKRSPMITEGEQKRKDIVPSLKAGIINSSELEEALGWWFLLMEVNRHVIDAPRCYAWVCRLCHGAADIRLNGKKQKESAK